MEESVKDETSIRQFLKGVYGAKGPNGELVFVPEKGIIKENLAKAGESRILNGEVSLASPTAAQPRDAEASTSRNADNKPDTRLLRRTILPPRPAPNP